MSIISPSLIRRWTALKLIRNSIDPKRLIFNPLFPLYLQITTSAKKLWEKGGVSDMKIPTGSSLAPLQLHGGPEQMWRDSTWSTQGETILATPRRYHESNASAGILRWVWEWAEQRCFYTCRLKRWWSSIWNLMGKSSSQGCAASEEQQQQQQQRKTQLTRIFVSCAVFTVKLISILRRVD